MGDRKMQIEKNLDLLLRAVKDPHFTQHPMNAPPTLIALSRAVLALADEVWPQQTPEPEHDREPDMTEKTPNILPTIGRVVHYVSHGSADGTYPSVCRAAIVTEVPEKIYEGGDWMENTDRASLCVINPTGTFFSEGRRHAEAREMKGGTWHWACPPQAKVEHEEAMIVAQGKTMTLGPDEGMGPVEPYQPDEDDTDPGPITLVQGLCPEASDLAMALAHTVQYVGYDRLPARPGWAWYDALMRQAPDLAQSMADDAARVAYQRLRGS